MWLDIYDIVMSEDRMFPYAECLPRHPALGQDVCWDIVTQCAMSPLVQNISPHLSCVSILDNVYKGMKEGLKEQVSSKCQD